MYQSHALIVKNIFRMIIFDLRYMILISGNSKNSTFIFALKQCQHILSSIDPHSVMWISIHATLMFINPSMWCNIQDHICQKYLSEYILLKPKFYFQILVNIATISTLHKLNVKVLYKRQLFSTVLSLVIFSCSIQIFYCIVSYMILV